jgi:hypothetical protein
LRIAIRRRPDAHAKANFHIRLSSVNAHPCQFINIVTSFVAIFSLFAPLG